MLLNIAIPNSRKLLEGNHQTSDSLRRSYAAGPSLPTQALCLAGVSTEVPLLAILD
jgi:hypothetical protein